MNPNQSSKRPNRRVPSEKRSGPKKETRRTETVDKGKSSGIVSKILSVLCTLFLIMLITGTIVGAAFALYLRSFVDISVDDVLLLSSEQDQSTQIYYMDYSDRANRVGEPVLLEDQNLSAGENRVWVNYNEMPENLVNAFIAIEDKDFRDHNGVDWGRTISATMYYFLPGGKHYGGSTITQQVIKNVTGNADVTIQRKVQEIFMALNLEKKLDKSEIIEIYLNTIYLSQRSYGVQAAAKTYFGKDVSELSLIECAAIASIPQAPTKWDPVQYPDNNTDRRKVVLTAMRDQGFVTEEEYLEAWNGELELHLDSETGESAESYNSWYTDQVINDSIDLIMEQMGVSKEVATSMIYTKGLKIYTLMDPDVQSALESAFLNESNFPTVSGGIQPKCAMVIIDPYTGDVLGIVGDRGQKSGDRIQSFATQTRRSPGSTIKPLSVYAPAMEEGLITYGSVFDDVPINYGEDNETPWPLNAPNEYRGLTTVHDAITRSVNTISIRVLEKLGVSTSFDYVKNKLHMGFVESEELESGYIISDMNASALALGGMSYGVTVEEMTAAYAMFVNGGTYYKPRTVLRILDSDNNVVVDNVSESNTVISETTAYIMSKMLELVVNDGTARSAITIDSTINVAGKTGTTNEDVDKWFVGYTPYYVGGVWFGYEWNKPLTGFSSAVSAKVWNNVMYEVHKKIFTEIDAGNEEKQYFRNASGIVTANYCKYSGMLLTDACAADPRGNPSEKGYFTVSGVPTEKCDCHVMVEICTESGKVANSGCTSTKEVSYTKYDRTEPPEEADVAIHDAGYIYDDDGDTCDKHTPAGPDSSDGDDDSDKDGKDTTDTTNVTNTTDKTDPTESADTTQASKPAGTR